jgi:ubiquinone/menaquinone biosynthesis C-methylase UbiE
MTSPPNFDRIAAAYQFLERITFGPALHCCRTAHLDRFGGCRRALILGDGDGRFAADLVKRYPHLSADCVDLSGRMIELARRRVLAIAGAAGRVRFFAADARTANWPDRGYDLVATNFFLDCFPVDEVAALVRRVLPVCTPDVLWLDGDFRLPQAGWPRLTARLLLWVMYRAFWVSTGLAVGSLADSTPIFNGCGFSLVSEKSRLCGFLSSRLWRRAASNENVLTPT